MVVADPRADLVTDVRRRVAQIQRLYARGGEQPTSYGAATVAALRRADPGAPGDDPALWQVTLEDLPASLAGAGDDPSRGERAVHAALCLYAVHQQSRPDPVHVDGRRLGQAVRALAMARATGEELDSSVVNRLHQLGTATTSLRRLNVLRSLVTLMRSERGARTSLDYGLLARDLYDLDGRGAAPWVRLAWGRDLRRRRSDERDGAVSDASSSVASPSLS